MNPFKKNASGSAQGSNANRSAEGGKTWSEATVAGGVAANGWDSGPNFGANGVGGHGGTDRSSWTFGNEHNQHEHRSGTTANGGGGWSNDWGDHNGSGIGDSGGWGNGWGDKKSDWD